MKPPTWAWPGGFLGQSDIHRRRTSPPAASAKALQARRQQERSGWGFLHQKGNQLRRGCGNGDGGVWREQFGPKARSLSRFLAIALLVLPVMLQGPSPASSPCLKRKMGVKSRLCIRFCNKWQRGGLGKPPVFLGPLGGGRGIFLRPGYQKARWWCAPTTCSFKGSLRHHLLEK